MKQTRLEQLYRQKLIRSEASPKTLPTEHILEKEMNYFPDEPQWDHLHIVEIGPGNGEFLFHLAKENPSANLLGIEIGNKRFEKIKKGIGARFLKNTIIANGDARIPFYKNIKDNSLDRIYILFPDPWPKNRHAHRRLLQKDFLEIVLKKLKPGGQFLHATDVQDYKTWVQANAESLLTENKISGAIKEGERFEELIPTYFQRKWEDHGRSFYYLKFEKKL
ncbi:MAG: tRNA (guanosine(46)-N7)-methyltransferase TrmB [Deltaproteobacteria bacterium]|nr:tRNA (guanosine(46)-N7)-methyltransferase TrmB [Deltaproteobacteria bacterium]